MDTQPPQMWIIRRREDEQQQIEPLTTAQVVNKLKRGEVRPFDYVRQASGGRWLLAQQIEIADLEAAPASAEQDRAPPTGELSKRLWQSLYEEIDQGTAQLIARLNEERSDQRTSLESTPQGNSDEAAVGATLITDNDLVDDPEQRFLSKAVSSQTIPASDNEVTNTSTEDVLASTASAPRSEAVPSVSNIDHAQVESPIATLHPRGKETTNNPKPPIIASHARPTPEHRRPSSKTEFKEAYGRIIEYDSFVGEGEIEVDGKRFDFDSSMISNFVSPSAIRDGHAKVKIAVQRGVLHLKSLEVGSQYSHEAQFRQGMIIKNRLQLEALERSRAQGTAKHGMLLSSWAEIDFNRACRQLEALADGKDELWQFPNGRQFGILENYLRYTFYRLVYEDKIAFSATHACFNTGLSDKWNNPIFAFFARIGRSWQPFKFLAFCVEGEGNYRQEFTRNFPRPPDQAHYQYQSFDGRAEVKIQGIHVIDAGIERGRFPFEFLKRFAPPALLADAENTASWRKRLVTAFYDDTGGSYRREILARVSHAKELARRRCRSNSTTAIPCYYPEVDEVSLLLPLCLMDQTNPDVALVLRRVSNEASLGMTVYSLEMAYTNSRLVNKPFSYWLNSGIKTRGSADDDLELE